MSSFLLVHLTLQLSLPFQAKAKTFLFCGYLFSSLYQTITNIETEIQQLERKLKEVRTTKHLRKRMYNFNNWNNDLASGNSDGSGLSRWYFFWLDSVSLEAGHAAEQKALVGEGDLASDIDSAKVTPGQCDSSLAGRSEKTSLCCQGSLKTTSYQKVEIGFELEKCIKKNLIIQYFQHFSGILIPEKEITTLYRSHYEGLHLVLGRFLLFRFSIPMPGYQFSIQILSAFIGISGIGVSVGSIPNFVNSGLIPNTQFQVRFRFWSSIPDTGYLWKELVPVSTLPGNSQLQEIYCSLRIMRFSTFICLENWATALHKE